MSYAKILGAVSPTARGAGRAYDIVAALSPPAKPEGDSTALARVVPKEEPHESPWRVALGLAPGLVGGAVGAFVWKRHRVLGFLTGHALSSNALPIFHGGMERTEALHRLGIEGAGVGGALLGGAHPVWGWFAGTAVGLAASAMLPGSPVKGAWERAKAEWNKK